MIKKIVKNLIKISLLLTLTLSLTPLQANAEVTVDFLGEYADAETYNNTSSSSSDTWYGTYINGTGYRGQGVLL